MFIALSNIYIAFMISNIRINCAKKNYFIWNKWNVCDKIELYILNLDSPFICDFDMGVLLDETLVDDRFGEAGRDRMFERRRLLSLMDDEGAVTVVVCVKDNSCDSCCRRRRCCRSIETSVAGHTDKFGDPGTIDDVIDDVVIVADVGVRGGQSSFPSALSPASPLLCLVCK